MLNKKILLSTKGIKLQPVKDMQIPLSTLKSHTSTGIYNDLFIPVNNKFLAKAIQAFCWHSRKAYVLSIKLEATSWPSNQIIIHFKKNGYEYSIRNSNRLGNSFTFEFYSWPAWGNTYEGSPSSGNVKVNDVWIETV